MDKDDVVAEFVCWTIWTPYKTNSQSVAEFAYLCLSGAPFRSKRLLMRPPAVNPTAFGRSDAIIKQTSYNVTNIMN